MNDQDRPQGEYLKPEYVSEALASEGREHLSLGLGRAIGSALLAGAFVTFRSAAVGPRLRRHRD